MRMLPTDPCLKVWIWFESLVNVRRLKVTTTYFNSGLVVLYFLRLGFKCNTRTGFWDISWTNMYDNFLESLTIILPSTNFYLYSCTFQDIEEGLFCPRQVRTFTSSTRIDLEITHWILAIKVFLTIQESNPANLGTNQRLTNYLWPLS